MGFTDYGNYGSLETPSGSVLLRPDQYAQFGIEPQPSIEEPPAPLGADPGVALAPPLEAPTFDPAQVQAEQAVMAQQQTPTPTWVAESSMVQPGSETVSRAAPPPADVASMAADEQTPPAARRAPTNLSGATFGDVYDEKTGALGDAAQALAAQSAAEVENNAAKAAALQQRNDAVAAHEAKAAEDEVRRQAAIEKTTADHAAAVKEFANAKVDRASYRVSPMQWIGVLLSGLGSTMKGEGKNPALDLLMRQIDQYVDDGYRAKEGLGQNAKAVADHLDVLKGAATDARASRSLVKVGLMEKAARDAEAMLPLMQNRKAASDLQLGIADLRAKQSEVFGEGVTSQTALDQQIANRKQQDIESRRSAATAAANRNENARQFNLTYDQQLIADEEKRIAAVANARTEEEKHIAQVGVPDLYMTDAGGDEVMYMAREGSQGNPGMIAQDVTEKWAAAKTLDGLISEGIRLRDSFRGDFGKLKKSDEWQKYTANITAAGVAWSKLNKMGTWDSGTERAVLGAQGGDPNRDGYLADLLEGTLTGKATVGIEQFRKNAASSFNTYADSMRLPGTKYVPWKPPPVNFGANAIKRRTDEMVDAIRKDKTPDQIVASGAAGWSARLPGDRADKFAALARAASDPSGNISKGQAAKIADLATIASTGKNANGSASDPASAIAALEALASDNIDKYPGTVNRALDTLAKLGAEESLERVEAALSSQAKGEGGRVASSIDREAASLPVRLAREQAREQEQRQRVANDPQLQKVPDVATLASMAQRGDKNAAGMLFAIATGRAPVRDGKKPTGAEILAAQAALPRKVGK